VAITIVPPAADAAGRSHEATIATAARTAGESLTRRI
jgi:hypothetical protein